MTKLGYGVLLIVALIPIVSYALPADDVCNGKANGDPCTYERDNVNRSGASIGTSETISSFCARGLFNTNKLSCDENKNAWKTCRKLNDACEKDSKKGVCKQPGRNLTCDTSETPTTNPGTTTGGGTCQDCDKKKCNSGEVCADRGGEPTCVPDTGDSGTCDKKKCNSGEVCADRGGEPTCVPNQCTGGGGGGNGGGGTSTPGGNNVSAPGVTSPQAITFQNPIRASTIPELIATIVNALLGILAAITVAVLVLSGFKYMTSSNPGEVGQALDGIRNAIVGLMILMGAFLITQYIISALAG